MVRWVWVIIAAALVISCALAFLAWVYVRPITPSDKKDLLQVIAQIFGGATLLASLLVTWWNLNQTQQVANENLKNARETLKVTQEGQVTDRFLRAVEQLGNKDRTELRLGAIYSLERISRTSEADYWPIIELICAFLRSNAPVSDTTESPTHRAKHSILASEAAHRGEDIQAAITMIGRRRNPSRGDEPVALYLASVDLSDLHLEQANLAGAVLWSTSFKGAVLAQADLRGARLTAASLEDANLTDRKSVV